MNKRRLLIYFILLFFVYSIPCLAGSKDKVTLVFSPKDQSVVTETVNAVLIKKIGTEVIKDESKVKTRLLFHKTEKGWDIKALPVEIEMKRNSEVVANPVSQILMDNPVVYKIDKDGHIKDVKGYAEIQKSLYQTFNMDYADAVAKVFNEKDMKQKAFLEWNMRTGNYVGKTVYNDFISLDKQDIYLSKDNSLTCDIKTRFLLNQTFKNKNLLKIIITYNNRAYNKDHVINGTAEIFVDPLTMKIYSQKIEKNMSFLIDRPGSNPVRVSIEEKRDYSYN